MKPETFQTFSQVAISIGIILTAIGGLTSYYSNKIIDKAKEKTAIAKEQKLQGNIDELLDGNRSLQSKIEPFEELAKQLHPSLETNDALQQLRKDYENLEDRAEALEQKTANRSLSSHQRTVLVSALRKIGVQKITITTVWGDQEAFQFATELKDVFEEGGWEVNGVDQAAYNVPVTGLVIEVGTDPPPQVANELVQALLNANLQMNRYINNQLSGGEIQLVVGSKR